LVQSSKTPLTLASDAGTEGHVACERETDSRTSCAQSRSYQVEMELLEDRPDVDCRLLWKLFRIEQYFWL